MYVTGTEVVTPGGRTAGAIDAKDYGSKGVHMITNCGVGASGPSAIYILDRSMRSHTEVHSQNAESAHNKS
jgi:hypothetical protein